MIVERVEPRWQGETVIVAGTGPSLPVDSAEKCTGFHQIAVNDAYLRLPSADVLYAADVKWWVHHLGVPGFKGERWSCAGVGKNEADFDLRLVRGVDATGFSNDPSKIHLGGNSGFQAINLAILFGAAKIVLIGFDMTGWHFFGKHPSPLYNADPKRFIEAFQKASRGLKTKIINCTEKSALKCFPILSLDDALK